MKRPLGCKDFERMTFESVHGVMRDAESKKLTLVMTDQGWGARKTYGWVAGQKEVVWRKHMLNEVYRLESEVFSTTRPLTNMIRDQPKTYRVSLNEKGGVEVVCFDLENVDSELEGYYDEVSDLPTWVQERIAVLSVCNPDPPTPVVEGVGRRISEGIFWIYK